MKLKDKTVLVCNCEGTMPLDGGALAKACGSDEAPRVHSQLCRAQIESFENAARGGEPVLVACTQEAPLFDETLAEGGLETAVSYTNIRERAGWSENAGKTTPKIAALLAEAVLDMPPAHTVTMSSEGVCLVYGRDQAALDAAQQLSGRLDVTLLLAEADDVIPPRVTDVPIFRGRITSATGHLGAFEIAVDGYAPLTVSSRGAMAFEGGQDARSTCDLILDLTGGAPLFPAHDKRDGYFRPDPGNPAAVQKALFDLTDLVGEFEKPRYVAFNASLCAHSRSRLTGCTRCLDACPASAIRSAGDVVEIDPFVCGGCGVCHSVCPTGAAAYTLPTGNGLLERLKTLLAAYGKAGGRRPVLFVHDRPHGDDMISMMARFGRGLPANVLPFAVNQVTQVGLDLLAGALAYGASELRLLVGPSKRDEAAALEEQVALANAIFAGLGYGDDRVALIAEDDPDQVEAALYGLADRDPPKAGSFLPMGEKRALIWLALGHLHRAAPAPVDVLPLPEHAPFGTLSVNVEGCTLCLACVGACPTGALSDNPDTPRLSFTETACVQCGLCRTTCPEKVISLVPQLNFTEAARGPVVVKEEEPYACVRCGKPFGTKSAIERIVEQLAGKHSMFQDGAQADLIRMCEDCRILAQTEMDGGFLGGGPRPRMRTTEDYLREREEAKAREKAAAGRPNAPGRGNGSG